MSAITNQIISKLGLQNVKLPGIMIQFCATLAKKPEAEQDVVIEAFKQFNADKPGFFREAIKAGWAALNTYNGQQLKLQAKNAFVDQVTRAAQGQVDRGNLAPEDRNEFINGGVQAGQDQEWFQAAWHAVNLKRARQFAEANYPDHVEKFMEVARQNPKFMIPAGRKAMQELNPELRAQNLRKQMQSKANTFVKDGRIEEEEKNLFIEAACKAEEGVNPVHAGLVAVNNQRLEDHALGQFPDELERQAFIRAAFEFQPDPNSTLGVFRQKKDAGWAAVKLVRIERELKKNRNWTPAECELFRAMALERNTHEAYQAVNDRRTAARIEQQLSQFSKGKGKQNANTNGKGGSKGRKDHRKGQNAAIAATLQTMAS